MSTFHGLEVGRRGITTAQHQINTTGHNMANAATPGYARQSVSASASTPKSVFTSSSSQGQLGTGLLTDAIVRMRDHFLDTKFWTQNSHSSSLKAQADTLKEIESIVKTSGDGSLPQAMQAIWDAWQNVANHPTDAGAKEILVERAHSFLTTVSTMNQQMDQAASDIQTKIDGGLIETNALLKGIRDLNEVVTRSGGTNNDAMDQRDQLIDQLSAKVGIDVVRASDGTVQISLKQPDGEASLPLVGGDGVVREMTPDMKSTAGELAGLQQSLKDVKEYQQALRETVQASVEANGVSNGATTLFVGDVSTMDISVNTLRTFTKPGTDESEKYKIQSDWQAVMAKLGAKASGIYRAHQTAELSKMGIENDRQAVMGVSLDEEMSNLIKFQHAYNAAARMVSTTDELLDTLINRLGAR